MTREESLKFLSIDDEDDLQDAYEEILFEQKKFFLSKAPIAKLYESRISKLMKLDKAYSSLSPLIPLRSKLDYPQQYEISSSSILDTFLLFQTIKNEIKGQISNALSASDLIQMAQTLAKLEKTNAQIWHIELEDENDIIVSKEPDPMYLLDAIQSYRSSGGETFVQLKNLENNPPELLIQEMKRLSLLFKKY